MFSSSSPSASSSPSFLSALLDFSRRSASLISSIKPRFLPPTHLWSKSNHIDKTLSKAIPLLELLQSDTLTLSSLKKPLRDYILNLNLGFASLVLALSECFDQDFVSSLDDILRYKDAVTRELTNLNNFVRDLDLSVVRLHNKLNSVITTVELSKQPKLLSSSVEASLLRVFPPVKPCPNPVRVLFKFHEAEYVFWLSPHPNLVSDSTIVLFSTGELTLFTPASKALRSFSVSISHEISFEQVVHTVSPDSTLCSVVRVA